MMGSLALCECTIWQDHSRSANDGQLLIQDGIIRDDALPPRSTSSCYPEWILADYDVLSYLVLSWRRSPWRFCTTKYKFVSSRMNSGGISLSQFGSLASHKQTHTDGFVWVFGISCSMRSNSHSCSIRYALRRRSTTSSYNLRTVVALVCNSVPAVGVQPSGSPVASFGFMSRGCKSR